MSIIITDLIEHLTHCVNIDILANAITGPTSLADQYREQMKRTEGEDMKDAIKYLQDLDDFYSQIARPR